MERTWVLIVIVIGCSRAVGAAQPDFADSESFDEFRDRWNGWVGSLPADDRVHAGLTEVLDRFNHDRAQELSEHLTDWPIFVLADSRPWDQDWQHIEVVREVFQEDLDRLVETAQRPFFAAPIPTVNDEHDRLQAVLPRDWVSKHSIGSVSPLRSAIGYLRGDAVYLASINQQDRAIERFRLANKLSNDMLELPGDTQLLTQMAARSMLEILMVDMVRYDPNLFSDEQLGAMQSIMLAHLGTDYKQVFEFKQFLTHEDWRQQFLSVEFARTNRELRLHYYESSKVYTEGVFSSFIELSISPELDPGIPLAPLNRQIAVQSRMLDAMLIDLDADPAIQRLPMINQAMNKHLSGRNASKFIPVFVDAGFWRTLLNLLHKNDYESTNRIVVLAIHRHRVRHGQWPSSLDEIDPEALPIPAIDLYSAEPLRYALINGTPRLWALGTDRDDDGGRPLWVNQDKPRASTKEWFSLDEWDNLSEDRKLEYDGDFVIMD